MKTPSEKEREALLALDEMGIGYELIRHPAAASMEECAAIGAGTGARHCKNLFCTNKRGTEFWLIMIGMDKRFRTSVISKLLGSTRLSFAGEEQLETVLGLTEGSVSETGLNNDGERRVHVAIDRDILAEEKMLIHPNINTASLVVKTADVLEFIKRLGYGPEIIEVADFDDGRPPAAELP
ncbi:MAG: prolyl-tRNA synthetase associated domain-containing protein [Clostridia bacterium]|nr:prolyl-tRNA synthetase associated domain-containing protein [Clostridia bacterium]